MAKIELDKYYTSQELAVYCVAQTVAIVGGDNITEFVEPSAGTGVFLGYLDKPCLAFDIAPEHPSVKEQDYLALELPYKEGRCIIGNPPYGKGNYTSVKFFKRAILQGDFVSFILPISQLNNNMYMYEFDMIHSEDIGKQKYSGRLVHCVLNVYRRNADGLNIRPNYDLDDVTLRGVATGKSRNDKVPDDYDFSICGFGRIGTVAEREGQFCQQIYVSIHNGSLRQEITKVIKETDWLKLYGMTATPKLKHWMINKRLRSQLPELR